MEQKNIMIERFIEQIEDGKKYRGFFSIGGKCFDYELTFISPLLDIAKLLEEDMVEEKINQFVDVEIRRSDIKIALTKSEYYFFVMLLGDLAVRFYCDPQTRAANDLAVKFSPDILKDVTLGAKTVDACVLTPEGYEMFNALKFGCELSA